MELFTFSTQLDQKRENLNTPLLSSKASGADIILVSLPMTKKILLSLIYLVMVVMAFMIMLLVMTFNVGVFVTVIAGLSTGKLISFFIQIPELPEGVKQTLDCVTYQPRSDQCCTNFEEED